MKTAFKSADNNWQNGSTTYWFDVTLETKDKTKHMVLGVVESGSDEPVIVDDESHPIKGHWFECYVSDLPNHVTNEIRNW